MDVAATKLGDLDFGGNIEFGRSFMHFGPHALWSLHSLTTLLQFDTAQSQNMGVYRVVVVVVLTIGVHPPRPMMLIAYSPLFPQNLLISFPYFRKFINSSRLVDFFGLIYIFCFPTILTMMRLCIMICTYWTPLVFNTDYTFS